MKPNIIFIVSSNQRYDTFTKEVMPNLFGFAEKGVLYNNAFTCNTENLDLVLKTGRYISQRKFNKNKTRLDEGEKSLSDYFIEADYDVTSFNEISDAKNYLVDKEEFSKPFFMMLSNAVSSELSEEIFIDETFNPTKIKMPTDLVDFKVKRDKFNNYISNFNRLDNSLNALLGILKEKKVFKNTVVVYTSNRGWHFNTRNKKNVPTCHESVIHIPLVIFGGAFKAKGESNDLISLIDIPPTLLDLAGIYIPSSFFGNSLLTDSVEEVTKRENVYIENDSQKSVVLRTEKYKISVNKRAKISVCDYLYDLSNDKNEKINLANDKNFKEIREKLLKDISDEMETAFIKPAKIYKTIKLKKI